MKRSLKNIFMILIIISLGVCSYFTMKDVKETNSSSNKENQTIQGGQGANGENKGTPPQMPSENSNNSNSGTPPAKPSEENGNSPSDTNSVNQVSEPLAKSCEENGNSSSNTNSVNQMSEPPAKPGEENGNSSSDTNSVNQMSEPPAKPNGENSNNQMPKEMPNMNVENSNSGIRTIHYIMFVMEGVIISILITYLVMSKFNKFTLQETLNGTSKVIIFGLIIIIITTALTLAQICIAKKFFTAENSNSQNNQQMFPGENMNSSSNSVTKVGANEIDGTDETLTSSYTASESDESVILVENGGNVTLDGAKVTKISGDSSNTENSEFYGVNAGVLVTENSTATIKNTTISTNAKGSNAVFSTGTNSKIYISNSTITTTGTGSSRGLDATYGGYIEADNVNITTQGGSCATLATDRGEGTVIVKNSKLETNGRGSPVIYSTGDISITNTQGTANGSQMVVIEGKNSANVINSTLTASGKGNRGDTDQAGVMIYQSMSGDAGEGTGTFTATNSSLSIQTNSEYYKTAPMFFITNTDAIINLNNCKLSFGSNILISSKGTSEWGKSGSNGGNVTLNADKQTLEGNIEIDNISNLTMNLNNSSYTGTINADNTAKEIILKLDSNSSITLTGDSYITSLEDSDSSYNNINFNGYKLYVNGIAIN